MPRSHGVPLTAWCPLQPFYDKNRQRMYRKILDAPLTKPAVMSEEAFDCCRRMLDRNPTSRLGYNGADEVCSTRGPPARTLERRVLTCARLLGRSSATRSLHASTGTSWRARNWSRPSSLT